MTWKKTPNRLNKRQQAARALSLIISTLGRCSVEALGATSCCLWALPVMTFKQSGRLDLQPVKSANCFSNQVTINDQLHAGASGEPTFIDCCHYQKQTGLDSFHSQ